MSIPRVKRPFAGAASDPSQRQITSFFGAQDINSEPTRAPQLPANVESNLLTVGMRVRKSVPEGYKVSSPSAFKLWTDNTTASAKSSTTGARPARAVASRELQPFCGINKIGGLDTQPETATYESEEDVPALGDIPDLTLSQESTDSTESAESTANIRKRFFDDGDDAVEHAHPWVKSAEGDISPRTLTPSGFGNARTIAIPRSRMARKGMSVPKQTIDQENMVVDSDFEEAEFLVFGDAKEMDTRM